MIYLAFPGSSKQTSSILLQLYRCTSARNVTLNSCQISTASTSSSYSPDQDMSSGMDSICISSDEEGNETNSLPTEALIAALEQLKLTLGVESYIYMHAYYVFEPTNVKSKSLSQQLFYCSILPSDSRYLDSQSKCSIDSYKNTCCRGIIIIIIICCRGICSPS